MENATTPIVIQGVVLADWIAISILIATVAGIFFASWIGSAIDRRHRKRNACNAILRELQDTDIALNTELHPVTQDRDNGIFYRNAFLNADAYESVLHSGVFTEISPQTQNVLSNFYLRVKLRNQLLVIISNYNDRFFLNDVSQQRFDRWNIQSRSHHQTVTSYEDDIRNGLDTLRTMLNEEIS